VRYSRSVALEPEWEVSGSGGFVYNGTSLDLGGSIAEAHSSEIASADGREFRATLTAAPGCEVVHELIEVEVWERGGIILGAGSDIDTSEYEVMVDFRIESTPVEIECEGDS
jgi:hypothetical protein